MGIRLEEARAMGLAEAKQYLRIAYSAAAPERKTFVSLRRNRKGTLPPSP